MVTFMKYVRDQIAWSKRTFGPGPRTVGICKHVEKELVEIQAAPADLEEWIDVIILGLDGAWRSIEYARDRREVGPPPEQQILAMLHYKQQKNAARKWGPIRPQDQPNLHIKQGGE